MRVGRLILVVATIATIMVFPLLMHEALAALQLPSAYAAPNIFDNGGRVYQNGNNDPNNDDDDGNNNDNNDESDNEGEDNENVECYLNLNDNEPVPCDFEDNDNDPAPPPPAGDPGPPPGGPGGGPVGSASRCFAASETGAVFLDAPAYDVTVTVVHPLGAGTQLGLTALDPATVPVPPSGSTLLDAAVWQIDAQAGCSGASSHQLPAAVNLAFQYSIAANKADLQIVHLENGAWVEVQTVPDPDPNHPYISSTIQDAGTYAVIVQP